MTSQEILDFAKNTVSRSGKPVFDIVKLPTQDSDEALEETVLALRTLAHTSLIKVTVWLPGGIPSVFIPL